MLSLNVCELTSKLDLAVEGTRELGDHAHSGQLAGVQPSPASNTDQETSGDSPLVPVLAAGERVSAHTIVVHI